MPTTYTSPRTLTITLKDIGGNPVSGAVCYVRLVRGAASQAAIGAFSTDITDGDFIALGELASAATDALGITTMQLVPSVLLDNVFYVFYVSRGTFSYTTAFNMPDENSRLEDLIAMATRISGGGGGSIVLTDDSVEPRHLDADTAAKQLAFRQRIGVTTSGFTEITQRGVNDVTQSSTPISNAFTELAVTPDTPVVISFALGDKDNALLVSGSYLSAATKFFLLANAAGTVTATELTVTGMPTKGTSIHRAIGNTTSGLLFCGKDSAPPCIPI